MNLVTYSDRHCYGYFNCSSVRQGASDESPAAIGGTVPQGIKPIHNHCENGSMCSLDDGSVMGECVGA